MYVTRAYYASKYIFVNSYTPMKISLRQRVRKWRETPRAMEKYNNTRRSEKIQLLILNNFEKGYHITLDYPKGGRPETYAEAENNLVKALHKISRRLKKQGKEFKYLAVTERGKRAAALHHHLIIEHDPEVLHEIMSIWGQHVHIAVMYEEGAYKKLSEYFVKIETKEEATKGRSKYHRSRNLKEPAERVGLIQGKLTDRPFIPKGYELVEQSFRAGHNEVIGVRWQKYLLRRIGSEAAEPKREQKEVKKCTKRESVFSKLKRKIFGGGKR